MGAILDESESQPVRRAGIEPGREPLGVDPDAGIGGPRPVGIHQALDVGSLDAAEDAGDDVVHLGFGEQEIPLLSL